MEFLSMVSMAMIILFVLVFLFSEMLGDNSDEKRRIVMEDYGYSLQNEFILAGDAGEGYERKFTVPEDVEGVLFSAWNTHNTLILNYSSGDLALVIPETLGLVKKGNNII